MPRDLVDRRVRRRSGKAWLLAGVVVHVAYAKPPARSSRVVKTATTKTNQWWTDET
jgi:hypothetical protein